MNSISRKASLAAGTILSVGLTTATLTTNQVQAQNEYDGCGKTSGPCTIAGTTYDGNCVNTESECGCESGDGSELGPSPSCVVPPPPPTE